MGKTARCSDVAPISVPGLILGLLLALTAESCSWIGRLGQVLVPGPAEQASLEALVGDCRPEGPEATFSSAGGLVCEALLVAAGGSREVELIFAAGTPAHTRLAEWLVDDTAAGRLVRVRVDLETLKRPPEGTERVSRYRVEALR